MISVVLGRRGCGKTTLIQGYVEQRPRLLIFDTLAEYGSSGVMFRDIRPMIDYVEDRQYLQFRAVFQPVENDLDESFSDFMRLAWIVGDSTIVVDEIDQVSSAVRMPPELAKNLRYGRHRKLFVIAASRRAAEVPRLITSQADELISFNQSEPNDIKYVEAYAGKDFAARTATLPRYRALIYRSFEGTVTERDSRDPAETPVSLRSPSVKPPAVPPAQGKAAASPDETDGDHQDDEDDETPPAED